MCSTQGRNNPTPDSMTRLEEVEHPIDKGKPSGNFQGVVAGTNNINNKHQPYDKGADKLRDSDEDDYDDDDDDEDRMVICDKEEDDGTIIYIKLNLFNCLQQLFYNELNFVLLICIIKSFRELHCIRFGIIHCYK